MNPERNSGYVYFFECLNFKNQYKIGYSKSPYKRAMNFRSNGLQIKILKIIESKTARDLENEIQCIFYKYSHWNILQKLCNSKTARKKSDLTTALLKYSTPSNMSCEWFYLKPKRVIDVLEVFNTINDENKIPERMG